MFLSDGLVGDAACLKVHTLHIFGRNGPNPSFGGCFGPATGVIWALRALVSRLFGDLQGHAGRTYPSGPDPLSTPPPGPDLDLIWTRFRPKIALFGSKSGPGGGVERGSGPEG